MKLVTNLILSIFALPAFAISDKELSRECRETGIEKVVIQAAALNCTINVADIQVSNVDNRFYKPSKYIWYSITAQCEDRPRTLVTQLVQYREGQCY